MFTFAMEFNPDVNYQKSWLEIPDAIIAEKELRNKIKAFILVPAGKSVFALSINGETIFSFDQIENIPDLEYILKQVHIFLAQEN